MDLKVQILILTILLSIFLAVYVFFRRPQGAVQRTYFLLIICFCLWGLLRLLVFWSTNDSISVFLERTNYVLGLCIGWSFMNFALNFPFNAQKLSDFYKGIAWIISLVFVAVIMLNNGLIYGVATSGVGDKIFYMNFYWFAVYILLFLAIFVAAFSSLSSKLRALSGEMRFQIKLVIITTAVAVSGGLVFNLLGPLAGIFRYQIYGPIFTLPFSLTVAYLIFLRGRT